VNCTHETLETCPITVEPLAPDVVKLCTLLAHILNRCLQEHDPHILPLIGVSIVTSIPSREVPNEQAA
jgi:hypothetical protein